MEIMAIMEREICALWVRIWAPSETHRRKKEQIEEDGSFCRSWDFYKRIGIPYSANFVLPS